MVDDWEYAAGRRATPPPAELYGRVRAGRLIARWCDSTDQGAVDGTVLTAASK